MSLYQKYRPTDFDSLVWQDFVKIALENAILSNKLVWAYLFYGSRGTWKTTTARILAKAINCTDIKKDWNPCSSCPNCLAFANWELVDVIEIDAASNTWVDNIRELIEKAQFQPNYGKFKVYIIDEVHMLSKWAFNALLKTLEEPPKHVKFILATTEIHKIPETIISRTQRFDFKKITEKDIVDRLSFIAKNEWVKADNEALNLIARLSRWWLRDAISLFEQYSIWWNLKLDYLKDNLQLVWDDFLNTFIENIVNKNNPWIIENLNFLKNKWIEVRIFLEEIIFFLHNKILNNLESPTFNELVKVYDLFIDTYSKIKSVPNSFLLLEFNIIKNINLKDSWIEKNINVKQEEKREIKTEQKIKEEPKKEVKIEEKVGVEKKQKEFEFNLEKLLDGIKNDSGKWFVIMSIKSSQVIVKDWVIKIYANNDFNFEKLSSIENIGYLKDKIKELFWIEELVVEKNNLEKDMVNEASEIF